MPESPAIECRDVRKTFRTPGGDVEALHGTDATFRPGVLNAVVGPSGCGKSTLLRLVAGIDSADAGEIRTGADDVTRLHGRPLRGYRRSVVTYVAQRASANLVSHLRVRDHFEHGDGLELLEPLGLAEHLGSRAAELSGGEQARVALAAAVARRTPVLLLDEPTAELDRETASHVIDVLQRAADDGMNVVVATHDRDLVAVSGTRLDLAIARRPQLRHTRPAAHPGRSPALRVQGLTKRYGSTHAIENVSLELGAGEIGVVLGRSGSGKSTLLMALGGWLDCDAGEVDVGGPMVWGRVGYLPQRFGLLPELSLAENVGLPGRLAGAPPEAADGLLDALELGAVAGRLPGETSIGQQQRAALARALVQRPALLLADEPTSHQDAGSAELGWAAILDAQAHGAACLVATHDVDAATRGDRVWELVDGRLHTYASGSPPTSR